MKNEGKKCVYECRDDKKKCFSIGTTHSPGHSESYTRV